MSRSTPPHRTLSGMFPSGMQIQIGEHEGRFVITFSNIAEEKKEELYNQLFGYASAINEGSAPKEVRGIISIEKMETNTISATSNRQKTIEYFLSTLSENNVISPKRANAALSSFASSSEADGGVSPHTNGKKK